jgi:hypothetical protein
MAAMRRQRGIQLFDPTRGTRRADDLAKPMPIGSGKLVPPARAVAKQSSTWLEPHRQGPATAMPHTSAAQVGALDSIQ